VSHDGSATAVRCKGRRACKGPQTNFKRDNL